MICLFVIRPLYTLPFNLLIGSAVVSNRIVCFFKLPIVLILMGRCLIRAMIAGPLHQFALNRSDKQLHLRRDIGTSLLCLLANNTK
jgi:hypothetical protein